MNLAQRSHEEIYKLGLKKTQFGFSPPASSPPVNPCMCVCVCMSNLSVVVPVFLQGAP
jgi:hypothetical protein